MSSTDVIKIIKEGQGKHFDPVLTSILIKHWDKIIEIHDAYKDPL